MHACLYVYELPIAKLIDVCMFAVSSLDRPALIPAPHPWTEGGVCVLSTCVLTLIFLYTHRYVPHALRAMEGSGRRKRDSTRRPSSNRAYVRVCCRLSTCTN
jgi:hypothetical protein